MRTGNNFIGDGSLDKGLTYYGGTVGGLAEPELLEHLLDILADVAQLVIVALELRKPDLKSHSKSRI